VDGPPVDVFCVRNVELSVSSTRKLKYIGHRKESSADIIQGDSEL
jgi:hypothetical protein